MASILDKYGIKEVADVTFYHINKDTGVPDYPVLYLDTLKVSTIEQTAENTEARGGKGNPALISWDYGKEITVTLEDALFSAKSMAIMFGNGNPKGIKAATSNDTDISGMKVLMRTEEFITTNSSSASLPSDAAGWKALGWEDKYEGVGGATYSKLHPKFFTADGAVPSTDIGAYTKLFCTYDLATKDAHVIEINGDSFPGTYYVTGDTYARSEASGEDEYFQFIIPKAKMNAENTITLEAEGDPSVFNMSLRVMRPADGVMMKLVKYDLDNGTSAQDAGTESAIPHNHSLNSTNAAG